MHTRYEKEELGEICNWGGKKLTKIFGTSHSCVIEKIKKNAYKKEE